MAVSDEQSDMKMRVARTLKWNVVDKVASQLLYAVTGVILARLLSQADFGLIGAVLVFQAFGSLFIDSGFSYALIQRKQPTQTDYSTVLWFNLGMASLVYIILFFCAPLIADIFQGDRRLIPLTRVMLLTFIINASAIVQTNRLMKRMEVRMIAVSNSLGLFAGAIVGIGLAVGGFGVWALVWQAIAVAAVKSAVLWLTGGWRPDMKFSFPALRSFFRVGSGMMGTSFLNTLFQYIYPGIIGNVAGLVPLGYYTQSDKWSKMGVSSLSAVLTSSFLPVLSKYQDNPAEFASSAAKMNRFTSYLVFPAMIFLIVVATPLFHILFGTKWDPSIALFQLLLVRGIFTVLTQLYANYVMSRGKAALMVWTEILRDGITIAAILLTLPYISQTRPGNPTWGIEVMLWGQVAAGVAAWAATVWIAAPLTWRRRSQFLTDSAPYLAEALVAAAAMLAFIPLISNPWLLLPVQLIAGAGVYMGLNAMLPSAIQRDALNYIRGRGSKKRL